MFRFIRNFPSLRRFFSSRQNEKLEEKTHRALEVSAPEFTYLYYFNGGHY